MSRPLRSSCDRCHSHKLKCPKQPGVSTCTRCMKAGATCVFSPAGLSTRRALQTQNPGFFDADTDMSMQFDWPPLDLENVLATPLECSQGTLPYAPQQIGRPEAASQDPRSIYVRQLTALAAEIDQVFLDLSYVSRIHMPKTRPIEEYHTKFTQASSRTHCIENLFSLAQRLVDIYPHVLKVLFGRPETLECRDHDCFHMVKLPDELEVFFSTPNDDQNEIDTFLFNILVSCHTKVIDAMGVIVNCARTCTQVTFASPDLVEPNVHIAEVRVGSFVATSTSASTMQIALLIHVASVLVDYAQRLTERVAMTVKDERNDKKVQMLQLQCELLEEKSSSKMRLLEQVKGLFTKINFIK